MEKAEPYGEVWENRELRPELLRDIKQLLESLEDSLQKISEKMEQIERGEGDGEVLQLELKSRISAFNNRLQSLKAMPDLEV